MDNQSRYTAQAMRDAADTMDECLKEMENGNSMYWRDDHITSEDWKAMLRQAADAEEENTKLKASKERWMQYQETAAGERNACIDELRKKDAEIAQLKARLTAVVKECEKQIPACRGEDCKCNPTDNGYCDENCHDEIIVHTAVIAILHVARGEGSANA